MSVVKPAPSYVERRAFGRRETNIKATVRAGNCMHVCFIKDLSEGGALLEFENQVTLPSLLWLRWDDVPSEIICEVRRIHGNRAGVQFARPIVLATRHNASSAEPVAKSSPQPPSSPARVPVRETLVRAADLVAKHRSALRGGEKPVSDVAMVQPASLLEQINSVRRAQPPVRLMEPPPVPGRPETTNMGEPAAFAPASCRHKENIAAALSAPPAEEHEVPMSVAAVEASAEPIDESAVVPAATAVVPVPVRVSTGPVQLDLAWPPAAIPSIEASVRSMWLLNEPALETAARNVPVEAPLEVPTEGPVVRSGDVSAPDWLLPVPPCPLVARGYGVFVLPPRPLPAMAYLQG